MGNFFQRKTNWWIIGISIFLIGIIAYVSFFYGNKVFNQVSKNQDTSPVISVGIEDGLAEDLITKIEAFEKSQDLKLEFHLINKGEYPALDLLFVSTTLNGKTELVGNIATKEIVFANQAQKAPPVYVYVIKNNQYGVLNDLIDFVKKEISDKEEIILLAVGDIMLSRHVGTKIFESGNFHLPFLKTADILREADISFANLESPFYDQGPRVKEGMVFKAEPETITGLTFAGFDILSLANNHFGNQGRRGITYTFQHLQDNQIEYVGAGGNFKEAHEVKILEQKGIKFGFLAYNGIPPVSYQAGDSLGGHAWMDIDIMQKDIEEAKKKCDVVIVSMHTGAEYTPHPNTSQINFARGAIDAGANLVLGHHPHVVQAFETYKNGIIFYSLGNFVFDQMWSTETSQGVMAKIVFSGTQPVIFELIPIHIYNYNQPRIIKNQKEKEAILERIYQANQRLPKQEVEI